LIALAALSIGGGAFAYAGGFKYLESLFVTVDIDGESTQMELTPVGENAYEGTLQKQLEGGRQADIHVRHEEPTPGEKRMEVQVNVAGDGGGEQEVAEVVVERRQGPSETTQVASAADLGDAKPVHSWSNADGVEKALYIVPDEKAGLLRLFTTSQKGDENRVVRKAGQLPSDRFDGDPSISVGDNGVITLTWEMGDGDEKQKAVIKIAESMSDEEAAPEPGQVRVRTQSGVEVGIPTKMPPG